ncbi:PREDICTED: uncharacterized protein LOC104708253 [Camelina sativa]|uniref:Uncharacterized protein LOC104708253 n=1 Tax=Camelina sativa TaxID=90675 RepID=A0ABM0TA03_CAMSA|nr:PREDICTED: uncharacterized protein LOC104708253 [Camelina sativa]
MEKTSERGKSNFESFLKHISPRVFVKSRIQNRVGSSSSRGKAEAVRKPHIVLNDIWKAYNVWSCYTLGVPITLNWRSVNQYYAPTLSAIQIFTKKPLIDGSSSRSFGEDCHLYLEFNQTMRIEDRPPLIETVTKLANKHHGLGSLKVSDLSENSWFAVSWSPSIQIPEVQVVKGYFITYHSFTPVFPEPFPQEAKFELPAFGVVGSKLSNNVWIMPGTSDQENMNSLEESAASWLGKVMFTHTDFDMFMAQKKPNDLPSPSGVVTGE